MLAVNTACILQYDNEIKAISLKYVHVIHAKVEQPPWKITDNTRCIVMAGNNGKDCENFSAICEGLKSARSLCSSLGMSEKSFKAKCGQCIGTSSYGIKLAV